MENSDMLFKGVVVLLSFLWGLLGAVVRRAFLKIDENTKRTHQLEKELSDLKVDVAKNYIGKSDFNNFKNELFDRFDKIDRAIHNLLSK